MSINKSTALILVTLTAFFWGTSFNSGKYVLDVIPPFTLSAVRFTFAGLVFLIFIFPKFSEFVSVCRKNFLIFTVLGILGIVGFSNFFYLGLKYTEAFNGSIIVTTNPLITALLSSFILKTRLSRNEKAGMLFSMFGVLLIITHGSLHALLHLHFASGDLILLIANICWSLYGILGKTYIKDSSAIFTTAATILFSLPAFWLIAAFEPNGYHSILNQSHLVYLNLIYMGVFCTALAYFFWNIGIETLGIHSTYLFFNVVPLFTAIISLLSGEKIGFLPIIGGALVIIGVLYSMNVFHKQKQNNPL